MIRLTDLKRGDRARVLGFDPGHKIYQKRLMAMGLTQGIDFQVLRYAPLGDPIAINVRGCCICLRKNEAQLLQLEKCL